MTISINFVRILLVLFGHRKRVPPTDLIILFEGKKIDSFEIKLEHYFS